MNSSDVIVPVSLCGEILPAYVTLKGSELLMNGLPIGCFDMLVGQSQMLQGSFRYGIEHLRKCAMNVQLLQDQKKSVITCIERTLICCFTIEFLEKLLLQWGQTAGRLFS